MACFADTCYLSQGTVATYARRGGIFNIHLTVNLPRNLPVKKVAHRLRFDRIMVMSLWPRFYWPTMYSTIFVVRVICDPSVSVRLSVAALGAQLP